LDLTIHRTTYRTIRRSLNRRVIFGNVSVDVGVRVGVGVNFLTSKKDTVIILLKKGSLIISIGSMRVKTFLNESETKSVKSIFDFLIGELDRKFVVHVAVVIQ